MRTIKVDCPYCSMDHAVTFIPGWQQHKCFNCGHNFIVNIDDYGRVDVRREDDFSGAPCHEVFIEQFMKILREDSWKILDGYPKTIDIIAKKDISFSFQKNFIGIVNGDNFTDIRDVRHILDEFYDYIDRNTDSSSNMMYSFSGLLLLTFSNAYQTEIDDESREIEQHSIWKRIYTSVGVFDFSTERYFNSKTKYGGIWDVLVPPLFGEIDLEKCKGQ